MTMTTTYHKIQSVFKRDPTNKYKTFLWGEYSTPEFAYLARNKWVFTEKVNGTNIRVIVDKQADVKFRGKTDSTQIHPNLFQHLDSTFSQINMPEQFLTSQVNMLEQFPNGACLYGVGCGAEIQKGGENYYQDQRFVLFDVKVCGRWLQREDVEKVAFELGVPFAPVIGVGTLPDMVDKCMTGFNSRWGDFPAEGIVARPEVELHSRSGERVITKIKHRDF